MKSLLAACVVLAAAGVASAQSERDSQNEGTRATSRGLNQPPGPFEGRLEERVFEVTGTVVAARGDTVSIRIDDHQHVLPFRIASNVSRDDLKRGARVSLRYRPSGSSGQTAEEIRLLSVGPAGQGRRSTNP